MAKEPTSLLRATALSLVILCIAGLSLPLFDNALPHLILLILYLAFPMRWIIARLVRKRFLTGLGIALGLVVLQTLTFCLSALVYTLTGDTGLYVLIVALLGIYFSAAHAIVYGVTIVIAGIVRWMRSPPTRNAPPPPEEELGEKPGWDEGRKPPH